MPYITSWVDPEVFLVHKGITVYHTYNDNDFGQGRLTYWFTTNGFSDEDSFDVRELDVPSKVRLNDHPPFLSASSNPAFETASEEQKAEWRQQWAAWHDGGEENIIRAMIIEAIDLGLITAPEEK